MEKRDMKAEANALAKVEEEIMKRFPKFPFYQEALHNLSGIYNLPILDRRPIELKVKEKLRISGQIVGVKGSLLLLKIGDLPYFLDLNRLMGRKVELKEANSMIVQTALDRF